MYHQCGTITLGWILRMIGKGIGKGGILKTPERRFQVRA
jgi:hypothetical protein